MDDARIEPAVLDESMIAKLRSFRFVVIFTCLAFLSAMPVLGHTYHTSLTRLDHNSKKGLLEITIRVFIHDLVPVLEKINQRRIDLERSPDIDGMLERYVGQNFEIKDKKDVTQKLSWVGKEMDVDVAFLYFEIATSESPEGYSLKNSIFFESFPQQTNLLVSRSDKKKCDLVFVGGDTFKELSFKPSSKAGL